MKQKDKEYLRSCFIRMLVEGSFSCSDKELSLWAQRLEMPLHGTQWFCAVVKMLKPVENEAYEEMLLDLQNLCMKILQKEEWPGYAVVGYNMDVILLLNGQACSVAQFFSQFAEKLSRRMRCEVRIGIGRIYHGLKHIPVSREEAYEALEWCSEAVPVADAQDILPVRGGSSLTIQLARENILEQFNDGNLDHLRTNLEQMAEQVRINTFVQPDAPYPTSIRRTMIELLVEMLHIASDAGVDVDKEIGYVDPYRKIFELQGTPAIIQWVTEIAEGLSEAMRSRKKQIEMNQLEQVKRYIHAHISDMDLSLSSVSQTVNMSPGYFSAFFIREAGIGFKEYVTAERIVLAKRLLQDSRESINAISERCGFLSPSYFISVFKSQTGMTPGQYRKLKN